jgi:hypothetical protein
MSRIIDLTGQRFGKITVMEFYGTTKARQAIWTCRCDCGNEINVRASSLRNGDTKSCGCLQRKISKEVNTKHGEAHTRLHYIWSAMKDRCSNPHNHAFEHYGARGIFVCDEWQGYTNFRDWAISNGYEASLTIDRIDNCKGYSPDNCRWTTMKEQSNNRRSNHVISFEGESHTLEEWARIKGLKYGTLSSRINRCHWGIEKALTTK